MLADAACSFYCSVAWLLTLVILLSRVLLSTIKFLGACPCPTCLIAKDNIRNLGMKRDIHNHKQKVCTDNELNRMRIKRERKWMYEEGLSINSIAIKRNLDDESLVPMCVGT